jgi:hypothetical protein
MLGAVAFEIGGYWLRAHGVAVAKYWLFPFALFFWASLIVQWRASKVIRKRKRMGCCLTCGYDLRATPDRCPECGTIPLKKEMISN